MSGNSHPEGSLDSETDDDGSEDSWRVVSERNYLNLVDRSQAFEEMMDLYRHYERYGNHTDQDQFQVQFSDFDINDVPSDIDVDFRTSSGSYRRSHQPSSGSSPPNDWFDDSTSGDFQFHERIDNIDDRLDFHETQLQSHNQQLDSISWRRSIRSAAVSLSLLGIGSIGLIGVLAVWRLPLASVSFNFQLFVSAVMALIAAGLFVLGTIGFRQAFNEA